MTAHETWLAQLSANARTAKNPDLEAKAVACANMLQTVRERAEGWEEIYDTQRVGTRLLTNAEAAIYGACAARLREALEVP